jgi:hypothetical protein
LGVRPLSLGLGLVVAALLAAGCGGGGGDRLSKEDFQQQANATCTKYEKKLNAIGKPTSLEDIKAYVDKGIPVIQQGLAELRTLKPPEDLQSDYDRMLAEIEKSIPAARQLGEAAAENDPAAVQKALAAGNAARAAADDAAKTLGLTECLSG